jgi:hypothetical protein
MNEVCPHCKRPWVRGLKVIGPKRQAMLDYIASHPDGVTVPQIMDAIYADDPNGGAECRQVIPTMAFAINKQLKPIGYRVASTRGPGAIYTLVQIR